jgi:hypothetical protein
MTPRRHQSGELDYDGGISKSGDTAEPLQKDMIRV